MEPCVLSDVLCGLPKFDDPNLLVGFETSDDASVYLINDEQAIIQTVDIFPPVVDDPYFYGQIAAANALSDVYAMGGEPKLALNILCFPENQPVEIAGEILRGGYEKVQEAGAMITGGHTIRDKEPKYGLSVTGFSHPKDVLRNGGVKPGDVLLLTKPLGTGVLTTAAKADLLEKPAYDAMIRTMGRLNKYAAETMRHFAVSGCTDVTGFGLLGHAYEMAAASGYSLVIDSAAVSYLPEAKAFAEEGIIPAGSYRNRDFLGGKVSVAKSVELAAEDLLYDPQTSGGLLIALPERDGVRLLHMLEETGEEAALIGWAQERKDCHIIVK